MVAVAIGGAALGGIASSAIGASSANSAANTQADAANRAADMQWQQFQQMQQNLQPYMNLGTETIPQLQSFLNGGRLNNQFSFNPQDLQNTPGYQFALQQGLKSVQNANSASGLGLSGAQMKGAENFATGLAQNTYQQQYQNALQSYMTNYNTASDQYNRLAGLVGLGQNAAAGVGNAGLQTANQAGNYLTQGANAQAAGQIAGANAIGSGLSGIGNSGLLYGLLGGGGGGGGGLTANSVYGNVSSGGTPIYGFQ